MNLKESQTISNRFFDFSDIFFNTVCGILEESIKTENETFGIFSNNENIVESYNKLTKWSDINIMIPVLFNFFHALELYLKGAIFLKEGTEGNTNHDLTKLFEKFKENYQNKKDLINIFKFYIFPNKDCIVLNQFYRDYKNEICNSKKYYEMFKYPYDKKFEKAFDYKNLRNLEEIGLDFFKKLLKDIKIIQMKKQFNCI